MALYLKRIIDILGALIVLLLFLPIWIIVAILVKITSRGPIFFIQKRPGYKGCLFNILKFRTMQAGNNLMIKGQEVMKNDSRVTDIGRFLRRTKIDEIPQVINVLKGEMSLVGPRPERIESLKEYDQEISKRLHMKPGMTGLAQVSGNVYLELQDRYILDVYYVEHYSVGFDIRIIMRTVGVILFGEEKYKDSILRNE